MPASNKIRLLEAAAAIVAREGAAHLTIDGVAAEAGLSKGGVLYHYPSKRALLDGMLQRMLNEFDSRAERFRCPGGRELSAWIRAEQAQTPDERAASLAILANAAEDPSLLDPAKEPVRRVFEDVAGEAENADLATILLLAAEGIRFMRMLRLLPFDASEINRLQEKLLELAREA